MGQFTQPDPIGLAGGLNLYGFAAGDPLNGSDPYGLKVCFQGTAGEQRRMKRDFEKANRVNLDSYNESTGCADAASAVNPNDQYAVDLAAMISDPFFTALFAYGRVPGTPSDQAGSGFDHASGRFLIDPSDVGRAYGVAPEASGCRTVSGARYSAEMIWLHETAHALGGFNISYRRNGFSDPVMNLENDLQRSRRRPVRPPVCHTGH